MSLSMSFAASFFPERRYLSKMLVFISKHKDRLSINEISEETGIPNGQTTGKVTPTISYLSGMGLIEDNENRWYRLTDFGKAVMENDILMTQKVTQIACHFNMCDPSRGASSYNQLFSSITGNESYSKEAVAKEFGCKIGDSPFTAMYGMYTKPESFLKTRIMDVDKNGYIKFLPIPQYVELMPLFGALITTYQQRFFPKQQQITIDEFDMKTHFSKFMCWRSADMDGLLNQLASMNYVRIDANLTPIVFTVLKEKEQVWTEIYSQIV